jgi:hypothetical protein
MKIIATLALLSLASASFQLTDDEPEPTQREQKRQTPQWYWDDAMLKTKGVVRLTDQLFDESIQTNLWFVFFVFDRHNPAYPGLEYISRLMMEVSDLNLGMVAFVDVLDSGELLKETFDIESTPSAVLVREGLVYHMGTNKDKTITWTA